MEKRRFVLSIIFAIWAMTLAFTFYYLYGIYSEISSPASIDSRLDSRYVELYTVSPLAPDKLALGEDILVSKGDVIPVAIKHEDYSIHVFEINKDEDKVDLIINNFLFFSLKNAESKKFDLNNDNYYDLLISLNFIGANKTGLTLKSINEKRNVEDRIDGVINSIKQNSSLQSKLIALIFLIILVIITFYFLINYLIPVIRFRKRTAREKPSDTLDYLIDEFNNYRKNGEKIKASRIASRAKNLYNHMPGDEKKVFRSKIKSMENYIN